MKTTRFFITMALGLSLIGPCWNIHAKEDVESDPSPAHARTPIKYLIVVIGENHTFDNWFGGYKPVHGQTILNLLSKGITNEDGSPGPNFAAVAQQQADDPSVYMIDPNTDGAPLNQIEDPDPQSGTNNFYKQDGYQGGSYVLCADPGG